MAVVMYRLAVRFRFYGCLLYTSPASQEAVYEKLSDLSNLEKVKDRLPEDKVKNLSFDAESISDSFKYLPAIAFESRCGVMDGQTGDYTYIFRCKIRH